VAAKHDAIDRRSESDPVGVIGDFAQSAQPPAFEAATIKPAVSESGWSAYVEQQKHSHLQQHYAAERVGTSLRNYVCQSDRRACLGVRNRYDIVAKAPDNTPQEQPPLMLQTLLIDRFKLVLHHETRVLPSYEIVRGNGKLKLVENDSTSKGVDRAEVDRVQMPGYFASASAVSI